MSSFYDVLHFIEQNRRHTYKRITHNESTTLHVQQSSELALHVNSEVYVAKLRCHTTSTDIS
jgi:hypothetical protein